jgi:hypothetical protein
MRKGGGGGPKKRRGKKNRESGKKTERQNQVTVFVDFDLSTKLSVPTSRRPIFRGQEDKVNKSRMW